MKKWLKNNWKMLVIGVIFLVLIPILINIAFKMDFGIWAIQAEWNAGDALGFYGVIIAAALAVYGVYLTIDYSQKNYKDDLRNQVLPFFSVYNLKTKSKHSWLSGLDEKEDDSTNDNEGYKEYRVTDYCYILKNGKIEFANSLDKEQQELLDNGGFKWLTIKGVSMCVASDHICYPLEIENVGNGAAISFRIGFNRKNTPKEECLFAYGIPIKVGEKIMVHIFSEDCGKESPNLGDYLLELHYKDIYGHEYSQVHDINIAYSVDHNSPMISISYEEKQVLEKRNNDK